MTTGYACSSCPECSCAQNNERFRDYQRIMAEQAKASVAAREARECMARAPDIRGVYSARSREATNILAGAQSQARTFTREEVLTVLKALRAGGPDGAYADAVRNAYDSAIRTFERME